MATTGAEIASAYIALTVKAPGLKKDIGKELGAVDTGKYGAQMGDKLAAGMKKTLKVAGVGIAAVLGTALVKGFGRLKAIETAQAKMRGLGHDSKTVATAMDNALKSVQGTAFGLGDAATVAGGAMAAQIKPGKELETHLKRIANNAAAAGVGFDEMGAIFNKAATQANGVQNDIIGQLADKGIPIYAELGKQMGVTAGEVFKLASEGKVSFEVFSKAAEAAAGTVAAEMGNTTTGAFDNMMAALGRLGAKVLEDVFPLIGPLFKDITKWLDEAATHVEPLVTAFSSWLKDSITWLKENTGLIKGLVLSVAGLVAGFYTFKATVSTINAVKAAVAGVKSAVVLAKLAQDGWNIAARGGIGIQAAVTGATKAQTVAVKAGAIAQNVLNSALWKSPFTWVAAALAGLVAGLVWFFTKTETGKKVWAEFTRFLGEAWANISCFFTAAYENVIRPVFEGISAGVKAVGDFFVTAWTGYIQPVFDGLAKAAKWVWEVILQPIFDFIGFSFAIMAGLIVGTYEALIKPMLDAFGKGVAWLNENVVQPAIQAIGAAFTWVSENVIAPIVEGIKLYIKGWGIVVQWLYSTVIKPVIAAVGAAFNWVWLNVIKPVVDFIVAYFKLWGQVFSQLWTNQIKPTIDGIANVFRWLWDSVIKPVWDGIFGTIQSVWNKIKTVIDTMVRIVRSDPKKAFEAARDGIKTAWEAIQEIAKKPVKFVVETVINGLIGTMNKIPGVNLAKVSLPKGFAGGGVLPGYMAAKRDDVLMPMRSGEGVLVPEVVRGLGPGFVHALNAVGNSGGVSAVRSKFGSIGQGLAKGGMVHPLPGAVVTTPWMGYPGHTGIDLAKPQGTPVQAAAAGVVSKQFYHVNYGNMVDIAHGGGLSTRYAHMLANVAVKLGQSVKAGQVVGYEGSTGNSTGPHLHWEVLKNGNPIDPTGYLSGANGVTPLFGIIDGLLDFATGAFKKAFPGGGMWIDAAGGLMSQGVKSMVEWATDLLSIGGGTPLLYDNGGWLQPGLSLVNNKSGRPEPVFTAAEFDRMVAGGGGFRDGARFELVLDDGTPLRGYVREQAGDVFGERAGAVLDGNLASTFGRRR